MELYSQILDHGVIAYGTIFKHIRDRPDEPFMFHCTGSLFIYLLKGVRQMVNIIPPRQRGKTEPVCFQPSYLKYLFSFYSQPSSLIIYS